MRYYITSDSSATDYVARRGRVHHVAEPSDSVIERAVRVQVQRAQNFTLTPGEREEARACLESLEVQFRVATGAEMEIAV